MATKTTTTTTPPPVVSLHPPYFGGLNGSLFTPAQLAAMYQPPSMMNLIRDPNDPTRSKIVWSDPAVATAPNNPASTGALNIPASPAISSGVTNQAPTQQNPGQLTQTSPVTPITSGINIGAGPAQNFSGLFQPYQSTFFQQLPTGTVSVVEDPAQIAAASGAATAPTSAPTANVGGGAQGIYSSWLTPEISSLWSGIGNYFNNNFGGTNLGGLGESISPITVTPQQTLSDLSSGKTGSNTGLQGFFGQFGNLNNDLNALINVGGYIPGGNIPSMIAGGLKGLYDSSSGDVSNTNNMDWLSRQLFAPGYAQQAGQWLGNQFFGGSSLPISAANDPNAQIGNQSSGGNLTAGNIAGPDFSQIGQIMANIPGLNTGGALYGSSNSLGGPGGQTWAGGLGNSFGGFFDVGMMPWGA